MIMDLKDVVLGLDGFPTHTYIFVPEDVVEVNASTPTMLFGYDDDPRPAGWRYFLEVPTVRDVLAQWSYWHNNRPPSVDEACAAIIYYADHDAYILDDLNDEQAMD